MSNVISIKATDPAWQRRAAAALHYLETHGGSIKKSFQDHIEVKAFPLNEREALSCRTSAKVETSDPDSTEEDKAGYYQHELRALAAAFAQCDIPESGWKLPPTPPPAPAY